MEYYWFHMLCLQSPQANSRRCYTKPARYLHWQAVYDSTYKACLMMVRLQKLSWLHKLSRPLSKETRVGATNLFREEINGSTGTQRLFTNQSGWKLVWTSAQDAWFDEGVRSKQQNLQISESFLVNPHKHALNLASNASFSSPYSIALPSCPWNQEASELKLIISRGF